MASKMNWGWKDRDPEKANQQAQANKSFKKWDEMTEQEQEERREQASEEGKAKYENMTDAQRQELKGREFYDFENNPACASLFKAIEERKDVMFFHIGTSGLLGGKVPDAQVKTKNGMVDGDYPTQFSAIVYSFDKESGSYQPSQDGGRLNISMIAIPDNVLQRTLESIEKGGYDVFTEGGIDKDTYVSGKGVFPMDDSRDMINDFFDKHKDAVKTGYNVLFNQSMLARMGVTVEADFDMMAVANEHNNAVSNGRDSVFGDINLIGKGERVTLDNIFANIAKEAYNNEVPKLTTAKSKVNAEAFMFLELEHSGEIVKMTEKAEEVQKSAEQKPAEQEKPAQKAEKTADKAEKSAEKTEEKADSKTEKTADKAEAKTADKATADKADEKADGKAEKTADKTEEKAEEKPKKERAKREPKVKAENSDIRYLAEQIAKQNELAQAQLEETRRYNDMVMKHYEMQRQQMDFLAKLWGTLNIVAPSMNEYLTAKAETETLENKNVENFIPKKEEEGKDGKGETAEPTVDKDNTEDEHEEP